jgi:hypothetical protein
MYSLFSTHTHTHTHTRARIRIGTNIQCPGCPSLYMRVGCEANSQGNCISRNCDAGPNIDEMTPESKSICTGKNHGETCVLNCNLGYEPSTDTLTCLYGRWTEATCNNINDCFPNPCMNGTFHSLISLTQLIHQSPLKTQRTQTSQEERVRTKSTGFNVNVHTTTLDHGVCLNMMIVVMATQQCVVMVRDVRAFLMTHTHIVHSHIANISYYPLTSPTYHITHSHHNSHASHSNRSARILTTTKLEHNNRLLS